MVRTRALIVILLAVWITQLRGEEAAKPTAVPIERRPYAIEARLAIDPSARIDSPGRAALVDAWLNQVHRFVGAPWNLEIVAAAGRFDALLPSELQESDFEPYRAGIDIIWAIRIAPADHGGFRILGRSYHALTSRLSPAIERAAPFPSDLTRSLLGAALDLFEPIAEIGPSVAGGVDLTIQGGALTAADPVGQLVQPGRVFVPVRLTEPAGGKPGRVIPIGWSYLKVEGIEGPVAHCAIISGLRDPLTRRIVGKSRLVAIGTKPAPVATRFRFETRPPNSVPAAGNTLTIRDAPDGSPHIVGMTDRTGRIAIPPRAADGLVIVRLLAGGVEPLVEFPVMPGESNEERVIRISPLDHAVALETKLNALRDEVVDLVAIRARLEARLKARSEGNAWDEVKSLLDEYQKLTPRQTYLDRLEAIRTEGERQQEQLKVPILTRTAQALVADTDALIGRYLDDEMLQAYERAYSEAQAGGLVAVPADWKPFNPPGNAFRVLLPPNPVRVDQPAELGGFRSFTHFFTARAQGADFGVGYLDPQASTLPASPIAARPALDRDREAIVAGQPGAKLLSQRNITLDGAPGTELQIEPRATNGKEPRVQRIRIWRSVSGRLFLAMVSGSNDAVTSSQAETFLNSFHIAAIPPKPAAEPSSPAPAPKPAPVPKSEPAKPEPAKAVPPGAIPF